MSTRGNMLRLARHFRGFTQKKTSEMLGIAQAVYSRMENDLVEVDDEIVARAAEALDLPQDFFDQKDTVYGPPVSVHPMLRGNSQVTAKDVDMITAELNLRVMHLRRFLESVDLRQTTEIPRLDIERYASPAEIADKVRLHWRIQSGPIKNLMRLVERAGVIVGYSDFRGAGISGVTFSVPGQAPLVLLNPDHPADRVRFTLAHELGHLVMHRFPTPEMEEDANEFASVFLFPKKELREAFRGRKVTLSVLASLKLEWKVSMQSILFAAQRDEIVSPNQARYLWTQISARGWKTREPASLDFEHEAPSVLPAIIDTQIDIGLKRGELQRMSRVGAADFNRLYPDASSESDRPRLRIVT